MVEQLRKLLGDDSLHVVTAGLASVAAAGWDLEVFQTEPESLIAEIEDNLGISISDFVRAKIIAAQVIYNTDLVRQDLATFIDVANLINVATETTPGVFNPLNATEIAIALSEIDLLDPPVEETIIIPADQNRFLLRDQVKRVKTTTPQYSDEIRKYWGIVLVQEGFPWAPPQIPDALMPNVEDFQDAAIFETMHQTIETLAEELAVAVANNKRDLEKELSQIPFPKNSSKS